MNEKRDDTNDCLRRMSDRITANKETIDRIWWVVLAILASNGVENVETLADVVASSIQPSEQIENVRIEE